VAGYSDEQQQDASDSNRRPAGTDLFRGTACLCASFIDCELRLQLHDCKEDIPTCCRSIDQKAVAIAPRHLPCVFSD